MKEFKRRIDQYLFKLLNVRIYNNKNSEYNYKFLKEIYLFTVEININSENLKADKNFISIGDDIIFKYVIK